MIHPFIDCTKKNAHIILYMYFLLHVDANAAAGVQGWVDCFEKATFSGSLFCGGISDPGEATIKEAELQKAFAFGRSIV